MTFTLMNIHAVVSQENRQELIREVNEQVWQVFKTSYETRDSEQFRSIHLKDVLRVHGGGIRLGFEYHQEIAAWKPLPAGMSLRIDFAFEARKFRDTVGYEVGYYRLIYERTGMASDTSYGRFHVVLKKVDQQWKIAQDYDTRRVGEIGMDRTFFESAEFLQLK